MGMTKGKNSVCYVGVDGATVSTGWGVLVAEDGVRGRRAYRYVACGVAKAPAGWPLPRRLASIRAQIAEVVRQHNPDAAAVELAFVSNNSRTAIALGEARGAILSQLYELGIADIADVTPRMVKAAVTGSGAAKKEEVARMVRASLAGGDQITCVGFDPTDALAIALTLALQRDSPMHAAGNLKSLRPRGRARRDRALPAHLLKRVVS